MVNRFSRKWMKSRHVFLVVHALMELVAVSFPLVLIFRPHSWSLLSYLTKLNLPLAIYLFFYLVIKTRLWNDLSCECFRAFKMCISELIWHLSLFCKVQFYWTDDLLASQNCCSYPIHTTTAMAIVHLVIPLQSFGIEMQVIFY